MTQQAAGTSTATPKPNKRTTTSCRNLSDMELAAQWATETKEIFRFDLPPDQVRPDWYRFEIGLTGQRIRKYLSQTIIDAHILAFCHKLNQEGYQIPITPAKCRAVRQMAILLRTVKRSYHHEQQAIKVQEGK